MQPCALFAVKQLSSPFFTGHVHSRNCLVPTIHVVNNNNHITTTTTPTPGSWDKTLKYWDGRQATPVLTVNLPERVYALDVKHPLLVVGCADRHIQVYNLSNPQAAYKTLQSPLKWQTRCVACFPGALVCAGCC